MNLVPSDVGVLAWAVIFPALGFIASGIAELLRASEGAKLSPMSPANPLLPIQPAGLQLQLQVPTTSELILPASSNNFIQSISVTEPTTALLDPARQKPIEKM